MNNNIRIVFIGEGVTPSTLIHDILYITKGKPFTIRRTLPKDVEMIGESVERLHLYVTIEMPE